MVVMEGTPIMMKETKGKEQSTDFVGRHIGNYDHALNAVQIVNVVRR